MATTLFPYKQRYSFDYRKTLEEAFDFVGANAEYEKTAQPAFMKSVGLKPEHRFLDLGCGCLRGTVGLIDYLLPGNFFGADISSGLLAKASEYAGRMGCKNHPNLFAITRFDFSKYLSRSIKFDYILSVSLLTHLFPNVLPDLFRGVSKILKPSGVWYFTMYPTNDGVFHKGNIECSFYDKKYLSYVGMDNGLKVEDIPGDYPNPCSNFIERVNTPQIGQWVMKASLL